jgi:two-component system CheB/CheR fusion protein
MAYVFVQHLDPRHASRLVEILSKRAGFPVEQAREGVKTLPDRLYVIAPNTNLTLGGGVLHLSSRDPVERPHRPIDAFFHSLARERGRMPLALSSLGADPMEQKVFKRSSGLTFAQDESSALFDGMPNSAIRTGCVDFILSPGDICALARLLAGKKKLRSPKFW